MDVPLLKASQFHPRFFHRVNARGKHAWRTSVQSFELVTPSLPIAPAEKGRAIGFIWIAHTYLYEQVTELLLGGMLPHFQQGTQIYREPAEAGGLQKRWLALVLLALLIYRPVLRGFHSLS